MSRHAKTWITVSRLKKKRSGKVNNIAAPDEI